MLKDSGADVINIADGPRATVRMGNLALTLKLQAEVDAEVLMHVCCRDRNLLGLQSHLLGAHVLGVRNLVVITGDPPKIGDYPDATAVYDLDSIGLLRLLHGFNLGVDPAGKPMPQTAFVLATGVEPAAVDFAREMVRLRQKVDAGANLIMTQPVYDPAALERFLEATTDLDVPVLVGILPLASYRNAEFIHNHIPGMSVPEAIRERMRKAGKGEAARREGIAIAAEALMRMRDRVAGAYIMPPLGRYEMAAAIIEQLGTDRQVGPKVPGRVEDSR
jgi:5,10-methylenetetrahydrofolate reductase